jgi:hypothetical protein
MALLLLLVITGEALFVIDAEFMSMIWVTGGDPTLATMTMLAALPMALFWGAAAVGLLALWNVLREEPLRHPMIAFAIGLTAFVTTQALSLRAYHDYKTTIERSSASNSPAAQETR